MKKRRVLDQINLFADLEDLPPSKPEKEEKEVPKRPVEGAVNLFECGLTKQRRTWKRHADDKVLNQFLSKVRKGLKEQLQDCGESISINVDYEMQTMHIGDLEFTVLANRNTGYVMEITMLQTLSYAPPEEGAWLFNKQQRPVEICRMGDGWARFVTIPWSVDFENTKNAYQTAYQINKLYHKAQMLWKNEKSA